MKNSFFSKSVKQLLLVSLLFVVSIVFAQAPTISSFTPTSGAVGATVTITGTGFNTTAANNVVYIGALRANVSTSTATSLTITVPNSAGVGLISVANTTTKLIATSALHFRPTNSVISSKDITGRSFANPVSVSTVSGNGTWYERGNIIAVADFNNDGKIDIAKGASNATIGILKNNCASVGSISASDFSSQANVPVGDVVSQLDSGDINGDGKIDLLVGGFNSGFTVVLNNSSASTIAFGTSNSGANDSDYYYFSLPYESARVKLGDVNGDGKLDVICSSYYAGSFRVFLNTSTTSSLTFSTTPAVFTTSLNGSRQMTTGDVNSDGKSDVIMGNDGTGGFLVFLSTSSGSTVSFQSPISLTGNGAGQAFVADVNGDGKNDVIGDGGGVFVNQDANNAYIASDFSLATGIISGLSTFTGISDFNGNGKIDLIGNAKVSDNKSSNTTLSSSNFVTIGFNATNAGESFAAADLDGDNKQDYIASSGSSSFVDIIRNKVGEPINFYPQYNSSLEYYGRWFTDPGVWSYSGGYDQNVYTTADYILNFDLAGSTSYTIYSDLTISSQMKFYSAPFDIGYYNLTSNGSITGFSSSAYIKTSGTGLFNRPVSTISTLFGIGNSTYNPVSITNNSGSSDNFSVRVEDVAYQNASSGILGYNSIQRQWSISKTNANGGSGVTIVFNWNASDSRNGNVTTPALFYYNGTTWAKITSGVTVSGNTLTLSGYTGTLSATKFVIADTTFGFVPPPVITSFTPTSGISGSTITISGSGFSGATEVKIGGTAVTSFNVVSATSITAVVANGTTGTIQVVTPGGTATSSGTFTILPSIIKTASINNFTTCAGTASTAQTFTLSGSNLTANISVGALTGYEYSLNGTTYASTLSIAPTSGSVSTTTIYVRLTSASTGSPAGNISLSSTNATTQTIAVSGTVNAITAISVHPSTTAVSVCQNATLSALSVTAAGASLTYRWYSNSTSSTSGATAITGAISASYSPVNSIASSLYYYCVVTGTCGTVTSNISGLITVSPTSVAGTATGTATICSGTTTTVSLTGNTGSIQWQSSPNNSTWTPITGAIAANFTSPALNATTYFRAVVTSGVCTAVNSSAVTVTVTSVALPTTTTSISLCQGNTSNALTATAASGHTLQWYTLASGGTASTTAPTPSTSSAGTTIYYVSQLNNTSNCESARVAITVIVYALPAAPTATTTINYCQGATATALAATATSGYSLQWYTGSTGGTASTTAPTPNTATVGSTTYYVSQKETAGSLVIDNPISGYYDNFISNFGQTFQVTSSVKLNSISIQSLYFSSSNSTTTLKIYNGFGGNLLATADAPFVNANPSWNTNNVSFSFSNQNVVLNSGVGYYFELVNTSTVYTRTSAPYTGGTGYANGSVISQDFAFKLESTLNVNPCESPRTAITVTINAVPTITGAQSMTVGGSTLQLTGSGTPGATTPWSSSNTAIATVSSTGVVTAVAGGNVTITYTNASGCSITAAIRVVDCAQPFGNALAFGQTTDFVQVNSSIFPSSTVTNFTIETWIRPSATDIVAGTPGGSWFGFLGSYNTLRNPSMWITNSGALHASWSENGSNFGTPVSASTPSSLVVDRWTHIALVKDGTTMRIYANGVQVQSTSCSASITIPNNFYWLGKVDNQFNGALDEVRFWSTTRTQTQLQNTMYTELVGNETGLLAYFDFNEGVAGVTNTSITSVTNKVNNTLNGTLTNFTRSGTSSNFVGNATANIDIVGAATICGNSTSQYTHPVTGGTWSVSNGATATISTTGLLTVTTNENITVSYAYTLNGCSFTVIRAVAINSPAAPVTNATINLCQGATTSALTATALSGHTLQWYTLATGGTASTTAPTPSSASLGILTYYVSQKNNTTNCESSRTAITVTVNAVPTISGAQSMTLGGNTIQLTGSGTAATTNPWVSSTTGIATISNTGEVTAVGAGSSIITYTVATGCTATAVISVVDCGQPFGNALQFDGLNDSFSTASNLSALNITGNISIETWIKFDQVHSDYVRIIGKGDSANRTYGLWLGTNGKLLFQIWGSFGSGINLEANTALQPGVWYHISATRNGNTSKIYINGIEDATTTITITPQTNTFPLTVGYGNMHTWLKGALDEVRVWNVARSLSQIQQGMYNALVGNETGLVAYFDFNQGIAGGNNTSIVSALDRTTNVLHGTLNNFTKTGTASNFVGNTAANFAITGAATLCANGTAQYAHQVSGGTWSVTNGANATISATGLLTAAANEDITVSYSYIVNGCSFTATRAISINTPAAPVAPATVNLCQGITGTVLTAAVTTGNTLQWYTVANGGTASTTAPTPSASTIGSTIFYVSQKNNTTNCESSRTAITVTVNAIPTITGIQSMTLGGATLQLTGSGTAATTNPWVSSTTGIATISNTGEVTAVAGGTTSITYTTAVGCAKTEIVKVTDCAAPFGNALNFDGVNDYAVVDNVGNNTNLSFAGTANFTIEAWVKRESTNGIAMIFSKYNGGVAGNYWLGIDSTGKPILSREASPWGVTATNPIPVNEWHHIAANYDGSQTKIYVDGVLSNTTSAPSSINNNVSNIKVNIGAGLANNSPAYLFKGDIDEIRVWNVARTALQISQNFRSSLQGNETGLVAYYDFNQGLPGGDNTAITSVVNSVNSTSNGTLTNFAKTGTASNIVNSASTIEINGSSTICGNATSQYTHLIPGGTWSVSNGAAASVSATGLLTTVGTESVTLTYNYTLNGCSKSATKSISIVAPSIPVQPSTTAQNVCINGTTASLSITATNINTTYQWYKNATASNTGGTLISGATTSGYTPLSNVAGTTYYYCIIGGTCSPNLSSTVSGAVIISPNSVAGTITGTATICSGTTTTLNLAGNVGTIQWQQLDNSTWTDIAGANSTAFTTPALTQNTSYRAVVRSGSCTAVNTSSYNVVVNNAPVITTQPSTLTQNVCLNGITSSLSVSATGAGLTYQWYNNTTATTTGGTIISGATFSVYMPSNNLSGTTYYYCVVSGTCSPAVTSDVSGAINISLTSVAGNILGATSVCTGTNSTVLTLSGNVGAIQWQSSTNNVTFINIAGETSSTYTATNLTSTTYYRAAVTSDSCAAINTATIIITATPLPVISGNTSVGLGDAITLSATTTAASSNAWVSSSPSVASVSNTGVVNGLSIGTTTITYTNSIGCTDTEIITVVGGTTQIPILTLPATNTSGATTLNFNYTLPETPLAGSVSLIITPSAGGTAIVWNMNNATSASFSYLVGSNPTSISNVVSGTSLSYTTYNITLSYQDAFGNPAASVTNTNIQTLAPPVISFANANYNGIINQPISIQTVNTGGGMVTYTITPALPAGLSLNAATGLISGTPTVTLSATTFTVTATNAAGTDTESFILFIDADTDGDGIGNANDPDIDGDGTLNGLDTNPTNPCLGFNANTASASWQTGDCDGDGIPNGSDADIDGNGTTDNGSDTDGDGINDASDTDIDGDGILNGVDNCPTIVNTSIVTQPSTQNVNSCLSTVPFALTVAAAGQQLTYQWYSNTSNSNSGGTVISGATTASYFPTTSYASRYYYVVVSGTCGTVTSNVSGAITINPISVAGSITGAASVCSGTNSTVLTLSGNTGTIQWQSSSDNISFTTITGATASTFTATNLTATTYYRAVVTSGVCSLATTASVTITVSPTSVVGSIAGATSVCSGTNSTVLTLSGNTGTIQWQSSTDNITFTTIAGATASTYTASNITATTYYRAVVTSGVCSSATTASVTITVSPTSLPGSIAGATSVCSGTNSTVLTLSGNTGTIQWQWSTDNVTFFNIPSATTSTYSATNISVTTYYRAVVTSGVCSSATTTVSTITVNPISVAGSISGAATVCSGTNSTVLTLSGNTGTIQWQSSTNNVTFTSITGANASTYTATNLTATTYYRAVVTSGVCSSATTASATITVNPTSVAGSIAGATTVCSATNSTVLTLSGNTGTIQWQSSTDNVTFTNIASATASTYTATNISATTYYRAVVTSGVCSSATTASVTITVNPISVAGSIAGAATVCSGTNSTVLTLSGNTGTIQWQSSTNNVTFTTITGATASTFTATNLTATTYYRAVVTSGVCSSATTASITITVNPTSVAGSIAGATTVCSATNSTVLTLSGNTGTIQWQSSTDNVTFTNIASATASTYTATNISATTYYRAVVISGVCSSATTAVAAITYIPIVAPTAVSNQQFCYLNNPTVSNLVTTSGVGIKWYATATGGIPLTGSTPLTTGTTYYASQTISVCESPTRVVVTVLLTCPVDAIADNFGSINGYAGATTASVLANDTINGGLLLPSQVILTGITVPTGLTLNTNGTITIAPQTAAGTYNVTYRICELLNPTNCDTVTFSIVVGACLDFAINDCDLDGESNGTEAANGTNPSDACSYTNAPASNNVVYPTWSVLDCDGDGVINGQEITDGTNPINPCSSNPINITLPLSTSFLNGDCDNDGLLNGEEIGSNVSYPNDSNGNGIPDYLEVNNHTVSEDNLEVYSSLTPNGDGNNDVFIIRNIENYPENNVSIFNRWGITVYDVDGYGQDNKYFKGISEGRITINSQDELPIGTYFYIIKYKNNNGEQKQRSGYLYINR